MTTTTPETKHYGDTTGCYSASPTPETDACASTSAQPRYVPVDFARKLERERDAARQAITLASDKLMIAISDRDAWKAKANASQQMVDALLKRGHVTRPSWGYHDGVFSIHISFNPGECGDDDVVSRNNLLKRLLEEESK